MEYEVKISRNGSGEIIALHIICSNGLTLTAYNALPNRKKSKEETELVKRFVEVMADLGISKINYD